ncbi:general substrate transporter [Cladochytrium replicatum]|nr:general substrate transporter [Cladochytrium replicatum]
MGKEEVVVSSAFNNSDNLNWYSPEFLHLYFACFIAFLNSAINGYDLSLLGGLSIVRPFLDTFAGVGAKEFPAADNALLFSLLQIGSIVGCFVCYIPMDYFGRRGGMITGSVFIIIGALVSTFTSSLPVFMFGRFVIGFGVVFVTTSAPVYAAEVAHPVFRGRAAAFYNTGWFVGSLPASAVVYGLSYLKNDLSWKVPVGLQAVFSGIVLLGSFLIPESPRWLVSKGKIDQAKAFLIKYHANNNPDAEIVAIELREITESIEDEKAQNASSFSALFATRAARYRMFLMLCVAFFSQYAGNWLAGYFQPQITKYFGIVGDDQALLLNVVTGIISFAAALGGASLVDKFGRRPYLFFGHVGYSLWYLLIIICLAVYYQGDAPEPEKATGPIAAGIAAFVFLQIFAINYSICWTPLNALYPVECLNYGARAKGMAICQLLINAANVFQSYVLSYGINAFRWKFFSFFLLFNILAATVVYIFFPETKGRTLEQLDEVFEAPNVVKASLTAPVLSADVATAEKA